MVRYLRVLGLWLALVSPVLAANGPIWVEGEAPAKKNVTPNAGFENVDPDELSGGAMLCSFAEEGKPAGTAEYEVNVETAGAYQFWVRANYGTGLGWKLDNGAMTPADIKAMQAENQDQRKTRAANPNWQPRLVQQSGAGKDGGFGFVFTAWLNLGKVDLTAGKHTLTFELGGSAPASKQHYAGIDCFMLASGDFTPNAKFKPGEPGWKATPEFDATKAWDFAPAQDMFDANALFDLRSLNEGTAGEKGFLKLSEDGNSFVTGDGKPIRFWGGSTYTQRDVSEAGKGWNKMSGEEALAHHARFLAKRGVNIVRLHGDITPKKDDQKFTDVDPKELDEIWRLVAAMKKEGIYTVIDPYWGSHTNAKASWGVPETGGGPGKGTLAGLVFFDPTVQTAYKAWLKAIYTQPNPHTGIPLAQDPSVGIIQIQNEDSMLFWTFQSVKGEALKVLKTQYAAWLTKKYGSYDKALEAWGGASVVEDQVPMEGLPPMWMLWDLTGDARTKKGSAPGREKSLADQLQFMSETMFNFNKTIEDYLHKDLGCKQIVMAGNWRSVDQIYVDDAERWSYTATEVEAKNHYYSRAHLGMNTGWQILPGQYYANESATQHPEAWPMNVRQVVGHPFVIPESLWVPPLLYASESPLMVAAQQCLTGVDTFYWFATGVPEWQDPMNIWTFAVPGMMGQFPAASLIFRKGYVKEGAPVVHEERSLQNIWDRKSPLIAEGGAFDPNRDAGNLPQDTAIKGGVDQLAFVVGPVEVKYGGDPAKSKVEDLSKYIDKEKKTVKSNTGEIQLDYGKGVYQVNAPKAQGAAGFLPAVGKIALADVTIECRNEYASVTVVPLDDQPIKSSKKVLVQVGTVYRPTGFQARPATFEADKQEIKGWRILNVGEKPWRVANTDLTVTVGNAGLTKATLLDVNGNAAGDVPVKSEGGKIAVTPPANAMYVVLQ
jgi:hypothetical protein